MFVNMRHLRRMAAGASSAIVFVGLAGVAPTSMAANVETLYRNFCSSCHGREMQGAMGPSLIDQKWVHGSTNEEIAAVIKNGVPKKGMPAWRKSLSDAQIRALVILIRESAAAEASPAEAPVADNIYAAAGHAFTLEKVAEAPGQLWSMDFLPEGGIIATQRDGKLWLFKDGEAGEQVSGTPKVWHQGQGGLLEVVAHPEYQRNGWIYLTFSDPGAKGAMTKVVRGKIENGQWSQQEDIFTAPTSFYTDAGVHFGSRLVFTDQHLYFSVGDRGDRERAQDLSYPYGKIYRLAHDGSVPADNPFVEQAKESPLAGIWSYGHRNPQGIALHPETGDLWVAEHGPRGGDEINLIEKAKNYGWPIISYGMNYDGSPLVDQTHKSGMEQPKHYWVPSIAVSEIDFYTGKVFSKWQNRLLVGSLAKQELRLLTIDGQRVMEDQLLLQGLGRIRDLADGPDGYPYLVLNNESGGIFRMVPAKEGAEK